MAKLAFSAVIFLCILAAAVVVLLGFAYFHHYQQKSEEPMTLPMVERAHDQDSYMREVRIRNQQNIASYTGWGRRGP